MSELVGIRRDGDVAVLTLQRPEKLNAISSAVEAALGDALDHPDVRASRCVVITGSPRTFSAGADVGEMRDMDVAAILAYYRATGGVYERVARLPQPTISAIAGYCLGGGFELALATDFRVADATATFGLPEVGIGIVPSSGGTLRLTRALGAARAKELILLGDRIDAERAHAYGLVTEVVAEGAALDRALALAGRLAALPAPAVALAKEIVDAAATASDETVLALERLGYAALAQTPEHAEATRAFTDRS